MQSSSIDLLYDAAMGVTPWSTALGHLATTFGANGAAILPEDPLTVELIPPAFGTAAGALRSFIDQGWYRNDIRARRAFPMAQRGQVVLFEHQLSTEVERRSEPYYQDFLWRFDMHWVACVAFAAERQRWALALFRGLSGEYFDEHEAPGLARLRPHLARAVRLAYALRSTEHASVRALLEASGTPLFALSFDGRVSWSSDEARRLVEPEVMLRQDRLVARNKHKDDQLQRAIDGATRALRPSAQSGDTAILFHGELRPKFVLDIVALPRTDMDAFMQTAAIVLVRPISSPALLDPGRLVTLLGLTPAEANVAALVAEGLGVQGAAKRLDIGYETARSHLARTYQKLGIGRQAELAEILAAMRGI